MLCLPQLGAVKVKPKVDSQVGELCQEIKRENLIAIGICENPYEAIDRAAFVNNSLQEDPFLVSYSYCTKISC